MRLLAAGLGALLVGAGLTSSACAQGAAQGDLDRRVAAVGNGMVEVHFGSRPDACGDGAEWYRVSNDVWNGTYVEVNGASGARAECTAGPVRVLISIAEREIIRIESFVGPLKRESAATDLGEIPAREAALWLLGLANRLDGRPARDAIVPAMLAAEGGTIAGLLTIARNKDRARETRRSAINWIPRATDASVENAARSLAQLARDDDDTPMVRQQAVSTLQRLSRGAGVAPLTEFALRSDDPWLAREATRALARSGDPRARSFLRGAVANTKLSDELRIVAIAGLGGDQATGADAKLLRDIFGTLESQKAKEAVLSAISSTGGSANTAWLMGVVRDERQPPALRRRAVSLAERGGATGNELSALYDAVSDSETRGAVISALAQEGSRSSREKLIAIAGSTETPSIRRRAISALERFDAPDVRDALMSLAAPRP